MMPHKNPTTTTSWKLIQEHYEALKNVHMKDLFEQDPQRAERLSISWGDFFFDYSKNRITDKTILLLLNLVEEMELNRLKEYYFNGGKINETERRDVLHTALRADDKTLIEVDGKNIIAEIAEVKRHMEHFSQGVISGKLTGYTGKPFTDVVNIGIGGSDLGPDMVIDALAFYRNHLKIHFVSNVDGDHVIETLKQLNPETTLFVVVSKTFTTQETRSNANTIKAWFLKHAKESDIAKHFVAVSTNHKQIQNFGIDQKNIFPMWDWVGGRFSLWSAVGLSISLSIGYNNFQALLEGAKEMDEHFKSAPPEKNIPVIMALLGIWYNNFFGAESEAIIPYTQYLKRFPAYLQQGIMESNGKYVGRDGTPVNYQTGSIIWGEPGTNAQHAFFQLIHQGTKLIPSDFIAFRQSLHGNKSHHNKLMANFFAQTEALLNGKTRDEVAAELANSSLSEHERQKLLPYKVFTGNKPTNTLLIEKLTPKTLGSLIALYEHKIFVQGVIWNIFSFDQWGVELGKQLAGLILEDIEGSSIKKHDSSTLQLIRRYKQSQ